MAKERSVLATKQNGHTDNKQTVLIEGNKVKGWKLSGVLGRLLYMADQLRVWHWQTHFYAAHKAFGDIEEALRGDMDILAEMAISNGQKPRGMQLEQVRDYESPADCVDWVKAQENYLLGAKSALQADRPDVQNKIDELIGLMNKLKYLLTLK